MTVLAPKLLTWTLRYVAREFNFFHREQFVQRLFRKNTWRSAQDTEIRHEQQQEPGEKGGYQAKHK